MSVTTRSMYGLRLIVYLLRKGGSATVREVAEAEGVPYRYMERIVQDMRRANLIASRRGRGGGISLINPENITLKDVVHALDGNLVDIPCFNDKKSCLRTPECDARDVWETLLKKIEKLCESIKINQLIRRNND